MLWPFITFLIFVAAVALHIWWRERLRTVQQEAEEELHKLKESYERASHQVKTQQEALFDSMAEGLLLLDENGRVQLANRALNRLFGVTSDIRSRTIIEALRLHELVELVETLREQKQVLGRELKLSRPNELWLQVNGSAIFDPAGRPRGTVLVFHDLTRIKQLERTRQEFVANVSHELRTPLSLIKGYVETLLDGAKDNPDIAVKFLQTIERNAERLKLLIEDLLTISELESGRVKLALQAVELRGPVEKVLSDFKAPAAAKQMELVDHVPDFKVRADVDRIEQVLCNLIDNAIKYGREGGKIVLNARQSDPEQVEISVQDDGPGIPAEAIERVFERFYRVDKARSREQGGTGLGLSIVKHIVQSHGGRAWARSEPGHGATFFFTLPQDGHSELKPAGST
ncbi:MAG TPA: ATP-binding protein [Verrucomicrobiae bacterium]|nr:ATP-binding protein [Verrucomicrobiae bacterium]